MLDLDGNFNHSVTLSSTTLGLNLRWSWQLFVMIFWWRAPPKGGRGHPLMVHHSTKAHLCSIIPWPIRREEYDKLQMILGILGHHGAPLCRLSGCNNLQMWLPQPGSLRTELYPFVANSECYLDPVCHHFRPSSSLIFPPPSTYVLPPPSSHPHPSSSMSPTPTPF